MFFAFAGKLAVTVVLGFTAGYFGGATEALGGRVPPSYGAGAFGAPVTHVGSIEWDLAQPSAPALRRIRCTPIAAAAATSCYVSR